MLSCERNRPRDVGGIRPHWDQSFVSEDGGHMLLPAELLRRFCQEFSNYDVTTVSPIKPTNKRCSGGRKIGTEAQDDCSRYYVNVGGPAVQPQTDDQNVSLRMDLSPMSPRAHPADTVGGRSSAVAQLALCRLRESGFYYGSTTPSKARDLLLPHPPGTFLVRASSDKRFLFSLTVRIYGMS